MTEQRHNANTITDAALDALYERLAKAERATNLLAYSHRRAEQAEAAIERLRKLAQQWAVLRAYGSAATELCAVLEEYPNAVACEHLGGGANAEDCPACVGTNPPYPFICPGTKDQ